MEKLLNKRTKLVKINAKLHREAKVLAAKAGIPLATLVEIAIEIHLKEFTIPKLSTHQSKKRAS